MHMCFMMYDVLYDMYVSVIFQYELYGGGSFAHPNLVAKTLLKDTDDENTKRNTSTFL